jgi:CHAT domain-containing protein/tetratricopeptide (TPR) repeat protein
MRHAGIAATLLLLTISGDRPVSQAGLGGTGVEAIRRALDEGRYAEAERLAVDRVAVAQASSDALGSAQASDLLVEALTRNGKIGEPATIALARRLVADKTALFGSDSPELASSLDNLGALSTDRGEFANAISLHERALAIRRRSVPADDRALAGTLERLAMPLIRLERFPEAQRNLDEARRIREPSFKTAPLDLARTSYLEALLHRRDGHYEAAMSALNQVLQTRLALAPNHPDNIAAFELNGDLLFLRGGVRQAEQQWNDALKLAEQTLGATHPVVPLLLHRLAIVAQEFGDLTRKRELLELAIRIEPGVQVPCFAELPAILNDFGTLNNYLGDFQQARMFFTEALVKARRCLGSTHSTTTTILHNQAVLAADMGDFRRAEELHRQAIRAWSQRLGPNHPYVARGLVELAGVAMSQGRTIEASELLERALRLRIRALGAETPDVASTLVQLARTMAARANGAGALDSVDRAIAIYERGNRPQSPDSVADALSLRGTLLLERGDNERGRDAFAMALSERERVFGAEHPLTAKVLAELASADFALGSVGSAVREALEAERIGRNHLRFTIRYLPELQALAYADKRPRGLDLALSAVADGRIPDRDRVMEAVVHSRGVVLDELGARAHLTAQSADPLLASLNADEAATRERFANLMMRSLKGENPVPRAILDEARTRKEEAERALAERSASERAEVAQANVGLNDVREMLPRNTALLAFVRYDRTVVTTSGAKSTPRTTASYMGFVIRSDTAAVDAVPLGSASTLESAVAAWRAQTEGQGMAAGVADAERAYRTAGAQLRRRIWDPFSKLLDNVTQVFVVPDGAINLVSFAALPTGTNRYLVEDGPVIHYLSTERDVVSGNSPPSGRGLLAVGGPAYGDRAQTVASFNALRAGCATLSGVHFEDLPGSRLEAAEIAKIWSSAAHESGDARVLSGRVATETTVKQAMVGRRVVHLATHGYFLQSPCDTRIAGTRGVGGLASRAAPSRDFAENALLLTGLAFAGANLRSSARADRNDDGILTAEEVAGLNLQGTEWAVLSACDTGTGQIKAGEGVFGLRRAFQVAGVRTIIMSLWSVEDRSTRIWMSHLYDARFNLHLSTADSVREASVRVLKERRSRRESTHPLYWAGFVAAGDWR